MPYTRVIVDDIAQIQREVGVPDSSGRTLTGWRSAFPTCWHSSGTGEYDTARVVVPNSRAGGVVVGDAVGEVYACATDGNAVAAIAERRQVIQHAACTGVGFQANAVNVAPLIVQVRALEIRTGVANPDAVIAPVMER